MTIARRDWKFAAVAAQLATITLLATAACAAPVGTGGDQDGTTDAPPPPVGNGSGANDVTGLGPDTGGATGSGGATGTGGSATGGTSGGGAAGGAGGDGGSGGEPPVTTPGLEASYSFEDSGTKITDDSGHGLDGQLLGTGAALSKGGKIGNALSFNGGSGHVRVPSTSSLDFTSAASIEFWVKLSSVSTGTVLSRLSPAGDGVRIRSTQGNLQVTFTRASGGSVVATTDAGMLGSTWTHIAVVNNGSELRIYLDGQLHRTEAGGKLGLVQSDLFIGAAGSSDTAINGYVDELAWWSIALTPEEVCTDAGGTWANGDCT